MRPEADWRRPQRRRINQNGWRARSSALRAHPAASATRSNGFQTQMETLGHAFECAADAIEGVDNAFECTRDALGDVGDAFECCADAIERTSDAIKRTCDPNECVGNPIECVLQGVVGNPDSPRASA